MDDDVIDVTHMSAEEYAEHMRHIEQLATCPCTNCQRVCDRVSIMHECEPYQLWLDYQMPERKNNPYAKKKRR